MASQQKKYPGAKTVDQFCEGRFCTYTYYKMRKAGWGPKEFRVPGVRTVLITAAAEREWEKRLQGREAQAAIKREYEQRSKNAKIAGDLSGASPLAHWRQRQKKAKTSPPTPSPTPKKQKSSPQTEAAE
jgi:hypothetical protein